MALILVAVAAVYVWRAAGGANRPVTADILTRAAIASGVAWLVGAVVALRILDAESSANVQAAFEPGFVPAAVLGMAGLVALIESVAQWREERAAGRNVKYRLPDWVVIVGWSGVILGVPLLSALVGAWFVDHVLMTVTQANEVARALAATVLVEALVLLLVAAVDVKFLRPRRIARDYASA